MTDSNSTYEDSADDSARDATGEGDAKPPSPDDASKNSEPSEESASAWWARRWVKALAVVLVLIAAGQAGVAEEMLKIGIPLGAIVYVVRRRLRAVQNADGDSALARIRAQQSRKEQVREGAKEIGTRAAKHVLKFGGGFYGVVATAAFFVFQTQAFWEDSRRAASTVSLTTQTMDIGALGTELWRVVLEMGLRVSVDTISSLVKASIWPLYFIQSAGPWVALPLLYVGYKGFQWLRRRYSTLDDLLAGQEQPGSSISGVSFDDPVDASSRDAEASSDGMVRLASSSSDTTSPDATSTGAASPEDVPDDDASTDAASQDAKSRGGAAP